MQADFSLVRQVAGVVRGLAGVGVALYNTYLKNYPELCSVIQKTSIEISKNQYDDSKISQ
ncbi:hypothetical protein Barb7_01954 [Bacteroidales bacterium Barb7]|nr:hypothetical protein Barb7_01954 [Bacteroidales bacterium Barb7]